MIKDWTMLKKTLWAVIAATLLAGCGDSDNDNNNADGDMVTPIDKPTIYIL